MTPIKKESIGRVVWSSALRMFDGNFIAVPRSLAGYGSPIVLNNACASWHRLAETFMFGNARAYIGTLVGLTDTEAQEVATRLLDRHFGKRLRLRFGMRRMKSTRMAQGAPTYSSEHTSNDFAPPQLTRLFSSTSTLCRPAKCGVEIGTEPIQTTKRSVER